MSARDDQPATVPPSAGEDDAYSATTKVGAMPADIMEKLRAEGLLPEEPPATVRKAAVPSVPRPSTSLEKRAPAAMPTPIAEFTPTGEGEPVPTLYSNAPPPPEPEELEAAPDAIEIATPVAFAFPPADGSVAPLAPPLPLPLPPPEVVRRDETTHAGRLAEPAKARPEAPSKLTLYAVAAFVVLALIVALFRLAR